MQCQQCNQNQADKTFVAHWMGTQYQMHFCNECLEKMWHYAGAMGNTAAFKAMSGWWPDKPEPRMLGDVVFQNIPESMKRRRNMAALRNQLKEATQNEDYEMAAQLRDGIAAIEQEV